MSFKNASDVAAAIASAGAREACHGEPDLIERIKKAMRACLGHFMATDEVDQFRAAIAAAWLESEGEDFKRLERTIEAQRRLSNLLRALQDGVPVDIDKIESVPEDVVPLRRLWEEVKAEKRSPS